MEGVKREQLVKDLNSYAINLSTGNYITDNHKIWKYRLYENVRPWYYVWSLIQTNANGIGFAHSGTWLRNLIQMIEFV